MKENLFEMLLSLFEKSLAQLKKNSEKPSLEPEPVDVNDLDELDIHQHMVCINEANEQSTRVITLIERMKLTKASYQFLVRMKQWGIVNHYVFEAILNQLQFSESRIVSLQETKWTIRNVLAESLEPDQLAFLDLVLYQKEDQLSLH